MRAHRGRDSRGIPALATTAWPASKAALAMSTPRPRPAPVMSQTFFSGTSAACSISPAGSITTKSKRALHSGGNAGQVLKGEVMNSPYRSLISTSLMALAVVTLSAARSRSHRPRPRRTRLQPASWRHSGPRRRRSRRTWRSSTTWTSTSIATRSGRTWEESCSGHRGALAGRPHTTGIQPHIADLKQQFVFAPDTKIAIHPIKIAQGNMTAVQGLMEGTSLNRCQSAAARRSRQPSKRSSWTWSQSADGRTAS